MAFSSLIKTRMFVWIERCIAEGTSLPSDAAIVEAYNLASVEQARSLLSDLADAGRITVKGGYGPDRVITLGRAKPAPVVPAPRPEPAAKKVDQDVERAAEKIMAIVARSPTAAAVKARNAAELLKTVTPTILPVRKPVPVKAKETAMAGLNIYLPVTSTAAIAAVEGYAKQNGCPVSAAASALIERGFAEPAATITPESTAELDISVLSTGLLLQEVSRRLTDAAGEADALRSAEDRTEQALARAAAAERKLADMRELLA